MKSVKEMKGANIIVDTCAKVQPDEKVLVVADWFTADFAERVAAAARQKNDNVSMALMEPPEHAGNDPPETIVGAMEKADVIFQFTERPIAHSEKARKASSENARDIVFGKPRLSQLRSGGIYADFEQMRPYCEKMAEKFTGANEAYITSPQGTDITVDISGREGNSHPSIADEPGSFTGLPNIEANIAPVSADGTAVFDGAVPDLDIGKLSDNITMEIEDGSVIDVNNGKNSRKIERIWEIYDDPAVYNIAQLAVGMNPKVREFTNGYQDAHARYGNIHLGIGTSTQLGGNTQTPLHFDAMMGEATLKLDDETVLKNGTDFSFIDLE